jgi:glycogen operon protein
MFVILNAGPDCEVALPRAQHTGWRRALCTADDDVCGVRGAADREVIPAQSIVAFVPQANGSAAPT